MLSRRDSRCNSTSDLVPVPQPPTQGQAAIGQGEDDLDFPVIKLMSDMRASVSPIVHDIPWYPGASKGETQAIKEVVMSVYTEPNPHPGL